MGRQPLHPLAGVPLVQKFGGAGCKGMAGPQDEGH